jgi:hypothetical protein
MSQGKRPNKPQPLFSQMVRRRILIPVETDLKIKQGAEKLGISPEDYLLKTIAAEAALSAATA